MAVIGDRMGEIIKFGCLIVILALLLPMAAAKATDDTRVIVVFKDRPNSDDIAHIKKCGGKIKRHLWLVNGEAVEIPANAIEKLKKNPRIKYVEKDVRVHTLQETLPWGVDRIDADVVWAYGNKGAGVNVCVIDTGIDYTHPDLSDNYRGGYDFVNDDADPLDDNGHGTHCAGIIAAENNSIGVVGVAPEVNLYAVKVLDRLGSGWLSDCIAGIQWAVDNNMDVVSMSWGSSVDSPSLKEACDNAYNAGLVLVAAAGNDGDGDPNTTEYSYPAAYDSVIAVGATNSSDAIADFSNTGPYLELAAPGVNIYSTLPTYRVTLTRTYGYDYGTLSGTSMACPHVAGVAALILASDPTLTNVDVRYILQTTADDLGPEKRDTAYGYGLVDADEAAGEDVIPPAISDLTPADGSYVNTSNVTISAIVSDTGGINASSIIMTVDGSVVNHTYNSTTGVVSCAAVLTEGVHTVSLNVSDVAGNSNSANWSFTVDITPPVISNVSVNATATTATITWTTNEPADSVVNYGNSTLLGSTASNAALVVNHSITLTGLTPDTTYYFEVQSTDVAGNTAVDNNGLYYNFTTSAARLMHVASIEMSTEVIKLNGWYTYAIATVIIVGDDGPVENATVYGHWSGLTTDTDSGLTDANGQISLESDAVKNAAGTYTFTVDNVVKDGWIYDSSANVETSDSITV